MICTSEDYLLTVIHLSQLAFRVEMKTAKNRLSQLDISQELGLLPNPGNVNANIGDEILVAQYQDRNITYRKIIVGDIQ